MRQEYNKLVRDGIVEEIYARGATPIFRILESDDEYDEALADKAYEELAEFFAARSAGEAGDVQAVWKTILHAAGITQEEADQAETEKHDRLGGFEARIFLESIDEPDVFPTADSE